MGKALDLALAQQEARAVAKAAIEPVVAEVPERVKLAAEVWLAAHPPKDGIDGTKGIDGVDGTNGRDGADGRAGTDGTDGRSITWRGTWKRTATYEPLSAVEYQGSSYITANPVPAGIRPPTKPWDLMAAKGQDGRTILANTGSSGGSGSGSALTVSDEGISLDAAVTSIDFAGSGVTATNVGHAVTVSIAGGTQNVYVQASDPGAVGAGKLWIDTTTPGTTDHRIRRRNAADDNWDDILLDYSTDASLVMTSPGWTFHVGSATFDITADGGTLEASAFLTGVGAAYLRVGGDRFETSYYSADGETLVTGFVADPAGLHVTSDAVTWDEHAGTSDPSAGAGIAAPLLSTYRRDNGGVGELWFKVGAADTDWSQVI